MRMVTANIADAMPAHDLLPIVEMLTLPELDNDMDELDSQLLVPKVFICCQQFGLEIINRECMVMQTIEKPNSESSRIGT